MLSRTSAEVSGLATTGTLHFEADVCFKRGLQRKITTAKSMCLQSQCSIYSRFLRECCNRSSGAARGNTHQVHNLSIGQTSHELRPPAAPHVKR